MKLPFDGARFDALTMGYGLRNVANIPVALSELHRVLKPGGWVAGSAAGWWGGRQREG